MLTITQAGMPFCAACPPELYRQQPGGLCCTPVLLLDAYIPAEMFVLKINHFHRMVSLFPGLFHGIAHGSNAQNPASGGNKLSVL